MKWHSMWIQFRSTVFVLLSFLIAGLHPAFGQSTTIAPEEYLGETAIPEAIKGFDEEKVKADPICDSSNRPEIDSVEPSEVSPGDRILITGKYFGKKKECLFGATIGAKEGKDLTYISDIKLAVTVPESVGTGLVFLSIQSGGGSARSAILVKNAP